MSYVILSIIVYLLLKIQSVVKNLKKKANQRSSVWSMDLLLKIEHLVF